MLLSTAQEEKQSSIHIEQRNPHKSSDESRPRFIDDFRRPAARLALLVDGCKKSPMFHRPLSQLKLRTIGVTFLEGGNDLLRAVRGQNFIFSMVMLLLMIRFPEMDCSIKITFQIKCF